MPLYVALDPAGDVIAFGESEEQLCTGLAQDQRASIYEVGEGAAFKLVKTVGLPDIKEQSRWVDLETAGWRLMIVTEVEPEVIRYLDVYSDRGRTLGVYHRIASRYTWEDDIGAGRLRPA